MLILSVRRFVETSEQCASSGEVDTVLYDVGIKLRRSLLESREHGVLYLGDGAVKTVGYLLIAYGTSIAVP